MIKRSCNVVPINNFQRQRCWSKCLEGNGEKSFEIDAYYLSYNDFSARPRFGAMFQALSFRDGYIDLHGVMHRWKAYLTV